ncbi:MAG: type 4a pilus biogenesis protein PilO [Gemmatimonadota bacterium]|nr:MAG: type 4a pilus biogenesis protein PilO [Gemmatimonadota bacterium]
MALLPADPRGRKQALFLMGVLVVATWYFVNTYLLSDRREEIALGEQQLQTLEMQNRRSRALAARKDDIQARLQLQERQLLIFEEFIPQSEEVPELLDAISREARVTTVELSRIRPQAAEAGQYYTKQTWELSVLGDYHNIGRYLARIASLPRIIKPTNIQMAPAPASRATRDMEAPLEVSLQIETFVLGVTPEAQAQQAQGASSG